MLAAVHHPDLYANVALPKQELLEVHRSKISLHHAKAGYSYPTIRLPHTFLKLAGLPTRIYQTVHDGALAFLVVISPTEKTAKSSEFPALTCRRSADSNNRQPTRDRLSEAKIHKITHRTQKNGQNAARQRHFCT